MKYDWTTLNKQANHLYERGKVHWTLRSLARGLGLPISTVGESLRKGRLFRFTGDNRGESLSPEPMPEVENLNEETHEATVTVRADDAISALERLEYMGYSAENWIIQKLFVGEYAQHTSHRFNLIPRNPEMQEPQLRPVTVDMPEIQKNPKYDHARRVMRTLVVPDLHFPFASGSAQRAILQLLEHECFEQIVFLGDILDLSDFTTRFLTFPDQMNLVQDGVTLANRFFALVRKLAGSETEIVALEGNHDLRFKTFLAAKMPAAFGLRTVVDTSIYDLDSYIDFKKYDIGWITGYPEAYWWIDERTVATHGDVALNVPGATAAKLSRPDSNIIFGHIHRTEYIFNGDTWACSPGMVAENDGSLPGSRKDNDWSQGVAILETYPNFTICRLHGIYNGELI